jgi:hypothetical protein
MSFNPANANGSATSANSAPVVIASDQAAVQAKITNGTTIADTVAGDAGQNFQLIGGARKEVSFTTTTVQAVGTTDVSNYNWVSVHIVTQGTSSTVNFQWSNDNTNWVTGGLVVASSATVGVVNSTTLAGFIYHGPRAGRYFRLNVTGIASGTTAGVIEFSANPSAMQTMGVVAAQTGAWNVGLAAATTGGYSSNAISTATTTTVKSGAGTLHTISILGGTAGAIDVYDNTAGSGTKLVPTFTPGSVTTPATLTFDVAFATGLTIVTGAATLLQVSYK